MPSVQDRLAVTTTWREGAVRKLVGIRLDGSGMR
jgi:hypothetical protein